MLNSKKEEIKIDETLLKKKYNFRFLLQTVSGNNKL